MKRKGEILIWDLEGIETTKAELQDLGFDRYLPRNNSSETFTKAMREYRKNAGNVLTERFNQDSDKVQVGVFSKHVAGEDLSLDKEIIVTFDKASGTMTTANPEHPAFEELTALYRRNSGTINTEQLRSLILKVVKNEAFGVSIRRNGGAYFVDDRYKGNLENVEKLFAAFPGNATLHRIVVYDDQSTLEAIESSVAGDLDNDITKLIEEIDDEFQKGTITEKKLENRKAMAEGILGKMKAHETNLRESYLKVHNKLSSMQKALEDVTSKVEAGLADTSSFMDLLKEL